MSENGPAWLGDCESRKVEMKMNMTRKKISSRLAYTPQSRLTATEVSFKLRAIRSSVTLLLMLAPSSQYARKSA